MSGRRAGWLPADVGLPLWVLPSVGVIMALVAGSVLTLVEVAEGSLLDGIAFRGGVEEARQMLAVIAGTMVTVTGLVFVLTVVALQLASTQFSPRLLRSFLADVGTQIVLATFVSTFAYSIAGLHTVGRVDPDGTVFLPRLAISGAMLLALASVGMLVFYIQHVTHSIRVDTIMQHSARDSLAAIESQHAPASGLAAVIPPSEDGADVPAPASGYLQGVDEQALARLAAVHDVQVVVTPMRGQHVLRGARAGYVVGAEVLPAGVVAALSACLDVQHERTVGRDVGFGIRQLVDITNRAMSSGTNDPYTAVQALHHLTEVLTVLPTRALGWTATPDHAGVPRVFVPHPTLADHLAMVCREIRPQAARSLRLAAEMLHLLARVGEVARTPQDRDMVALQIDLVVAQAEQGDVPEVDLQWLHGRARAAREALAGADVAVAPTG